MSEFIILGMALGVYILSAVLCRNNGIEGFFTGSIFTFVLILVLLKVTGIVDVYKEAKSNIIKCQKSLPRDQKCKLTAIPEVPK